MCLYLQAFTEKQINDVNINNLSLTRAYFEPQVHTQIEQSREIPMDTGFHPGGADGWVRV